MAVHVGHKNVMPIRRNRYRRWSEAQVQRRHRLVRRVGADFYLEDPKVPAKFGDGAREDVRSDRRGSHWPYIIRGKSRTLYYLEWRGIGRVDHRKGSPPSIAVVGHKNVAAVMRND